MDLVGNQTSFNELTELLFQQKLDKTKEKWKEKKIPTNNDRRKYRTDTTKSHSRRKFYENSDDSSQCYALDSINLFKLFIAVVVVGALFMFRWFVYATNFITIVWTSCSPKQWLNHVPLYIIIHSKWNKIYQNRDRLCSFSFHLKHFRLNLYLVLIFCVCLFDSTLIVRCAQNSGQGSDGSLGNMTDIRPSFNKVDNRLENDGQGLSYQKWTEQNLGSTGFKQQQSQKPQPQVYQKQRSDSVFYVTEVESLSNINHNSIGSGDFPKILSSSSKKVDNHKESGSIKTNSFDSSSGLSLLDSPLHIPLQSQSITPSKRKGSSIDLIDTEPSISTGNGADRLRKHHHVKREAHQHILNQSSINHQKEIRKLDQKSFYKSLRDFGLTDNILANPIPFSSVSVNINSKDNPNNNDNRDEFGSVEVEYERYLPSSSSSSSSSQSIEYQSSNEDATRSDHNEKWSDLDFHKKSKYVGPGEAFSASLIDNNSEDIVGGYSVQDSGEIPFQVLSSTSHQQEGDLKMLMFDQIETHSSSSSSNSILFDNWKGANHWIINNTRIQTKSPKTSRRARYVFQNKQNVNITWPVKKVAEVPGNITLGGLMMVHEREDKKICGPIMPQGGIQALEAMLYTIDYVNSKDDILPGITLGAYILDDCDKDTYGLEQSIDFIKGSITNLDDTYSCASGGGSGSHQRSHQRIWGVLGAASSATSIQVANLLRLFRIPQVSFFSTSSELSNKQRFEYFLRTVPSDKSQASAIVEIVKRLNWSYVSIIYEESIYGIRAFNDLEELLDQTNICIAIKERLTKDSGIAANSSYDNIVRKLATKPNSKGVIVFGSDQEVALLMQAVKRNNATGQFYWIGSDGWSARKLVFDGNEHQVEGTISVQPMANPVPGFVDYFFSLTPRNNVRNPWFIEYWEHIFKCKWPDGDLTPYNIQFEKNCTGNERLTDDEKDDVEMQLQFVSDAVLAFAYAIQSMQKELCPDIQRGVCEQMLSADGSLLLQHLKTVQFKGIDGHEFHFAENGDGPARYRIIHFKQVQLDQFDWIQVGEYVDGNLDLDLSKVQFRLNDPEPPQSVCSQPCEKGQAKAFVEGEKCCFHCINCTKYQILISETQCIDCASGFLPDPEQIECVPIPEEYMRPDSAWSIGALTFAVIGIVFTLFVIIIFIKYNDTPVVRASGRELCYVLLLGILSCYSMTLFLVQKPSLIICAVQKAGIGLCFSVVYSAILTKTNRIARIFKAGKRSARRPSFISPKSQLLICGGLILIQCFITAIWFAFSPPKVIHFHPTREDNKLICQASINGGYFVAFMYPIFLIVVCTVYAVITRNIPEAFNESKFIGFTMYTTCIIWLAFVPIYFTSSQSNHIALNITTLSVSVSLSATVTLMCLFVPKLYIILLHPEKNVRQSVTMPQHKYSSNYKTSSGMPPAAPPPTTASATSSSSNATGQIPAITANKLPIQPDMLSSSSCGGVVVVGAGNGGSGGGGGGQNALLKMTTCTHGNSSDKIDLNDEQKKQTKSLHSQVDSTTQSDEYELAEVTVIMAGHNMISSDHVHFNHGNGNMMIHNRRDSIKSLQQQPQPAGNNHHNSIKNTHRCRCYAYNSEPDYLTNQNRRLSKGTQTVVSNVKTCLSANSAAAAVGNNNSKTITAASTGSTKSNDLSGTSFQEIEQF